MQFAARFHDGVTGAVSDVACRVDGSGPGGVFVVADLATRREIAVWRADALYEVHSRPNELKIGAHGQPTGARIVVGGAEAVRAARQALPSLAHHRRLDRGRQLRIIGLATGALASVIVAYLVGIPLLAEQVVPAIPPDWEERMGDTVAAQIESTLGAEGQFEICDPDPNSVANRALTRFGQAALQGSGSPFDLHIAVVRSDVLNAFALPGGRVYYFSALLDRADNPDEFAGVLAHEIGHVVHRHSMKQLISGAGTGLLVGFVLGDMTGLSVAAGLGNLLIESRFSRGAEREADAFSAGVARRLAFDPAGLPDLLDKVAEDDDATRALALLSTHPLTTERRAAFERLKVDQSNLEPPFTEAEWRAIKTMCGNVDPIAPEPIVQNGRTRSAPNGPGDGGEGPN